MATTTTRSRRATGTPSAQPRIHAERKEIQPYGSLRLLPIALGADARAESCQVLNQVLADNPPAKTWADVDWASDADWDWNSAAQDSPEELRALLDEAVATSDRIRDEALASPDGLETVSKRRSRRDPERVYSLRWILVHMIEEYARHNGHADLIRESIDGQVGE